MGKTDKAKPEEFHRGHFPRDKAELLEKHGDIGVTYLDGSTLELRITGPIPKALKEHFTEITE